MLPIDVRQIVVMTYFLFHSYNGISIILRLFIVVFVLMLRNLLQVIKLTSFCQKSFAVVVWWFSVFAWTLNLALITAAFALTLEGIALATKLKSMA